MAASSLALLRFSLIQAGQDFAQIVHLSARLTVLPFGASFRFAVFVHESLIATGTRCCVGQALRQAKGSFVF